MAKVKIPKHVAGVKIPKKVRRKVKKAARMAESPVVREIAVAAAAAAAQAGAARAEARKAAAEARAVKRSPGAPGVAVPTDVDRVFDTVRAAALDGLHRFLEGLEEGLRDIETASAKASDSPSRASGRRAEASAD